MESLMLAAMPQGLQLVRMMTRLMSAICTLLSALLCRYGQCGFAGGAGDGEADGESDAGGNAPRAAAGSDDDDEALSAICKLVSTTL